MVNKRPSDEVRVMVGSSSKLFFYYAKKTDSVLVYKCSELLVIYIESKLKQNDHKLQHTQATMVATPVRRTASTDSQSPQSPRTGSSRSHRLWRIRIKFYFLYALKVGLVLITLYQFLYAFSLVQDTSAVGAASNAWLSQFVSSSGDHPGEPFPVPNQVLAIVKDRPVQRCEQGYRSCPSRKNKPIVYFNPLDKERLLCGKVIKPRTAIRLDTACNEPSRLYAKIPDLSGEGLPPIHTYFGNPGSSQPLASFRRFEDCDILCYHSGTPGLSSTRSIVGTRWSITFSMEGPAYYPQLFIQPDAYKGDRFYSTTSYLSEVPLPYFSWAEYEIQSPPLDYDKAERAALFLARNCGSKNNRESIVQKLIESSFRVDSLSSCLHNAEPPIGINMQDKDDVMRHYLFYLAFENQNQNDYITEKLWGSLRAGTVPVYYGAPNARDHVPNRSVIFVDDFPDINDLAAYLQKVADDKELYNSYHTWRTKPLPPHFHAKYDFTSVHSTCRTCRWAYARVYGLGWNHYNQSLEDLSVPRNVCVRNGRIVQPFVEEWRHGTAKDACFYEPRNATDCVKDWIIDDKVSIHESLNTCNVTDSTRQLSQHNLTRTIWEKDGIVDLEVEARAPYTLRLTTPLVDETVRTVRPGHLRLQNQKTRYTILVQPKETNLLGDKSGAINVEVRNKVVLRIIVEDIDTFHQGADQEENYFARRLFDDFYSPLEGYYEVSG